MTIHIPIPTGRIRRMLILLATCALIALLIGPAAIAQEGTTPEGAAPAGEDVAVVDPADPQAVAIFRTGVALQVIKVANPDAFQTTSQGFVTVPGSIVTFSVPTGATRTIDARYAAESACYRNSGTLTAATWCTVRIVVNGVEMSPAVGIDFAFDSTDQGRDTSGSWESHAMERVRKVGAGTYTLVVQARTTSAATTLRLDDSLLAVELHNP